jgi:predicted methyltransferase
MTLRRSAFVLAACGLVLAYAALAPRDALAFFGDDVAAETPRIARALELRPGDVVADVGAGDGSYAIALAAMVAPEGRVIATELDDDALAKIRGNVTDEHATNVTILRGGTDTTNLPPGCCDAVLMRGVYHHLTAPAAVDASVFAALKPGGRFLVVDFPPSFWLSPWTPKDIPADRGGHGIPLDVLAREVEAAGFTKVLVDEDWPTGLLTDLYGVVFEKPGGAPSR